MIDDAHARSLLATFVGSAHDAYAPATFYVGFLSAAPTLDANGAWTGVAEISGGGYARQAVANDDVNWPVPTTGRSRSNANAVSWTVSGGDWSTPNPGYFAVWDAATAGNLLTYGATSGTINGFAGNTVSIAANEIVWTVPTT